MAWIMLCSTYAYNSANGYPQIKKSIVPWMRVMDTSTPAAKKITSFHLPWKRTTRPTLPVKIRVWYLTENPNPIIKPAKRYKSNFCFLSSAFMIIQIPHIRKGIHTISTMFLTLRNGMKHNIASKRPTWFAVFLLKSFSVIL